MTRGTQPTQSAPPCAPGEPIAPVPDGRPARALSVHITSVSDGHPPTTVGTPHQVLMPTLAPGKPIASVSDGRPARVRSVQITSVPDGRPLSSAGAPPRGAGPAPVADSHRGTGTGGSSAPHFPVMPLLATNNATIPTASATTTLTASSSLDAIVDTAAGATATAASAAGTGVEVGTDPIPTMAAPPHCRTHILLPFVHTPECC